MTKLEAEIITALADNRLRLTDAAKVLFMHRTTVLYHVKKIRAATGENPLDFHGMCELFPKAKKILTGETAVAEGTWDALIKIGRQAHTMEENND